MKKLLVMMLVVTMSVAMLAGCNTNANGEATGQNTEAELALDSEEIISEEVLEMTLEEKIAAEMPAKLEVGEDEIIVPETVTAEQIIGRWEEIKVTEGEYAEIINDMNLAGLLVLNCSYMEPSEFNALVNEHFGGTDGLRGYFGDYLGYLKDDDGVYGNGLSVVPEELLFDEYLINQAEQIHYLIDMYQTDTENSKEFYDIIMNYLFYNENNLFTFDCDDERLQGSGLTSLQLIALSLIMNDLMEYDQDLYLDGVYSESFNNVFNVVNEHSNQ
ncbi:MAG: hypothetical protein E7284_10685 [Lachnospiraceae bacterium]|nr:hypothetical protein [Lachnospiraceae bacterium]